MKPTNNSIVYRKYPVNPRTWYLVSAALVLISVLPALFDGVPRFFPDVFIYALTWGLVFIIWLITLWSINRYGTVTITDTDFQVGRHKVAKTDINTVALWEVSQDETPVVERIIGSASNIDIPILLEAERLGNAPVFGGAYGVPAATDSFIMTMKDERQFTVPLPRGSRKEVLQHLLEKQ